MYMHSYTCSRSVEQYIENGTEMNEVKNKAWKEREDPKQISTAIICLGCIKVMSMLFSSPDYRLRSSWLYLVTSNTFPVQYLEETGYEHLPTQRSCYSHAIRCWSSVRSEVCWM
jgi:hypothetical protein